MIRFVVLTLAMLVSAWLSLLSAQNLCAREGQEYCQANPYSSTRQLELFRCFWTGSVLTPIYQGPCGTVRGGACTTIFESCGRGETCCAGLKCQTNYEMGRQRQCLPDGDDGCTNC